ncbi:MAG: hypothetical protein KJO55_03105 [Gammaproteobacteria bacterium]|nr:hypothetical protein [Gammaproteobacteria bacterium]
MEISTQALFPTPVWTARFDDFVEFNQRLLSAIHDLRQQLPEGVANTNVNGWQSPNDLQLREPFNEINARIMQICQHIGHACGYTSQAEYRYQAWANINTPGAFNNPHIHPNSHLSGVYYVSAPDDCGSIYFRDPRQLSLMSPPPLQSTNELTATEAAMPAEDGRIYVFPAWLEHGVQPNRSEAERIGISFNVQVVPAPPR